MVLKIGWHLYLTAGSEMYVRGHLVHCPRPKTGEAPHRASPFIFFIKAAGLASTSTHAARSRSVSRYGQISGWPRQRNKRVPSLFPEFPVQAACQSRRNPLPSVFRQNINSYLPHGITIRGTPPPIPPAFLHARPLRQEHPVPCAGCLTHCSTEEDKVTLNLQEKES